MSDFEEWWDKEVEGLISPVPWAKDAYQAGYSQCKKDAGEAIRKERELSDTHATWDRFERGELSGYQESVNIIKKLEPK